MSTEQSAKIDSYLLGRMSEAEREKFEDLLLADDGLVYEIAERENQLVDSFVSGSMENSLRNSFRDSLSKLPARREKIANASLLKTYIQETRKSTADETVSVPWYRRLGFAFQAPAFAAAALGLILVGAVGFLLVQNRNLNRQVASLNSNNQNVSQLREREAELQAELESLRAAGSDLTTDLESERERRTALEAELSELRKSISTGKPGTGLPITPTIATLILRPGGIRGGSSNVRNLRLENDEKRVALKIVLPAEEAEDSFTVKINDVAIANGIKPVNEAGGSNSLAVTVPSQSFRNGLNRVEVFRSSSQNVASFAVVCERGPVR
jgi:hypothetical protein